MEEMIEDFLYDKVIHYLKEFNECEEKSIDKAKREGWSNTQINHKLRCCGEM